MIRDPDTLRAKALEFTLHFTLRKKNEARI
jgi:hypothetical protein